MDWFIVMIIGIALGGITQWWVQHSFNRYSKVPLTTGKSGFQVARYILDSEGLHDVAIERVAGKLTDHYDPRGKVIRLSEAVYDSVSVAAAGVAAHEVGHAVQHAKAFAFFKFRSILVPTAQIGSSLAMPLVLGGLVLNFADLIWLGVIVFAGAVLFQLVTLPVEFDASKRALVALSTGNMLPSEQVGGAKTVLTAAALTYLAATLVAVIQLLYFLALARK